jgi:MFS family permease
MLDLSLFRIRLFSASTGAAVMNYMCLYSITLLMPFYLIQGRTMTAAGAGLVLSAQPLVMAIVAPISGSLSDRIGTRIPGTLGMLLLSVGLWLLSRLQEGTPVSQVAWMLALCGLGIGLFTSPNNSALMGSAPRNRQGIAAGILATARSVGMVVGFGMAGAIFNTVMAGHEVVSSPWLFAGVRAGFVGAVVVGGLGALVTALRE